MARVSVADDPGISVPEAWVVPGAELALRKPLIMGVLNVTPDSFSDGGSYAGPESAARRAAAMEAEGAGVIDVGGESTRPGALDVSATEEVDRVLPVIAAIRAAGVRIPISIDTRKAEVARAALGAGAVIVNDVSALGDPEMAPVVAEHDAGLVLMHMRGTPRTMQDDPIYDDVVEEVVGYLGRSMDRARLAGISPERVVIDPGIGFGKTTEHNLSLIRAIPRIRGLGRPVLIGVSRKGFIGRILGGAPADARLSGTIGACVYGLARGARIFRVHDVRPVAEALRVVHAIESGEVEA